MASDAHKIIATAGIVSVGVGTVNSFGKNHTPPSTRFLIGSGAAFLALSVLADIEPEIARALALAVMTTVLLGEGGGVLSYIDGRGETDTTKKDGPMRPKNDPNFIINAGTADELGEVSSAVVIPDVVVSIPNVQDSVSAIPGLSGQGHRRDCGCTSCSHIFWPR